MTRPPGGPEVTVSETSAPLPVPEATSYLSLLVASDEETVRELVRAEATRAGLLSSSALKTWLREQLRLRQIDELFAGMARMEASPDPEAMPPEEVAREIAAMRAERRSGTKH